MNIATKSDFRQALEHGPYAWPGGYPLYFITSDGGALSFAAAEQCQGEIESSIRHGLDDGWRVIATDINWDDADLICEHTGSHIACAYCE
jgi:hypothetical protein